LDKRRFKLSGLFIVSFSLLSCGIKGRPNVPLERPYIGRGKPTYRRAMKGFSSSRVPKLDRVEKHKKSKESEDE